MTYAYEELKSHIGFKKTPFNPGDNGEAFMGFLGFACSNSKEANSLHEAFKKSRNFNSCDFGIEVVAEFIDWLISSEWGEAPPPANIPSQPLTSRGNLPVRSS